MRRAAVLGAAFLVGCGATHHPAGLARRAAARPHCIGLTGYSIMGYRLCDGKTVRFGRKVIRVARPVGAGISGEWLDGFVSPDEKTLLLQWTAECETPYAFLVSVHGGTPRLVTGERTLRGAPLSIADGWTTDGRAIVELPEGGCGGGAQRPGIYLFTAPGKGTFVAPLSRR